MLLENQLIDNLISSILNLLGDVFQMVMFKYVKIWDLTFIGFILIANMSFNQHFLVGNLFKKSPTVTKSFNKAVHMCHL